MLRPCQKLSLHLTHTQKRLLGRAKTSGRIDDTEETIEKRLRTFEQETLPVSSRVAADCRSISRCPPVSPLVRCSFTADSDRACRFFQCRHLLDSAHISFPALQVRKYYDKCGLLRIVDAEPPPDQVTCFTSRMQRSIILSLLSCSTSIQQF